MRRKQMTYSPKSRANSKESQALKGKTNFSLAIQGVVADNPPTSFLPQLEE
jgi:hypothetical protein